jgi:hypothetical protein
MVSLQPIKFYEGPASDCLHLPMHIPLTGKAGSSEPAHPTVETNDN